MKYDIHEAAAAVAANHRLGCSDVLDIMRFAMSAMLIAAMAVALL